MLKSQLFENYFRKTAVILKEKTFNVLFDYVLYLDLVWLFHIKS